MTIAAEELRDRQDPRWGRDLHRGDPEEDTAGTDAGSASRWATRMAHREAVERVVDTMRQQMDRPLSLRAMARVALLSPYHFNRVFRSVTGVPPHTFLTALRMQAAKKLLLTTHLRVNDVCYSVGYQSIGTFTTRFKQLVGITPGGFRETSEQTMWALLGVLLGNAHDPPGPRAGGEGCAQVAGTVVDSQGRGGPTFVGLFPTPTSGGHPAACALLPGPDRYRLAPVPDGRYRVMAAAFEWSADIHDYLLPEDSRIWVGISRDTLDVEDGGVSGNADVTLRPKRAIDPPIVMSFPTSASLGTRSPANAP